VAEIAAKLSADPEDLLFLFFTETPAGQAAGRAYRSFVIAQEAPLAKLILYPDAGHAFLFQQAGRFVRDLLAFLTERAAA
jgi:pimeloyl-ACP methyl ester carboxylesterase